MATHSALHPAEVARAAREPLRYRQAVSLDEIDDWREAWGELDASADSPLSQFAWARAAYAALADEARPQVVAAWQGQRMLAVAPLVRRSIHGIARLALPAAGEPVEPMDLACGDAAAVDRLVRKLARGRMPLWLERVPADSPAVVQLKRACRGRALVIERPAPACAYIPLDEGWADPELRICQRHRSKLRKTRRAAEQLGEVTAEIHTPDLGDLAEVLDLAFQIEARSWKGTAGTAIDRDAVQSVLYRQFAHAACIEGSLRACFLRIGGQLAAMQLAIERHSAFWLLKVGYDPRFASVSPGSLLMSQSLRYAAEAGLSRYEFLGTVARWTQFWTDHERACVSLSLYPLGWRGLAAWIADRAFG